MESISDTVTRPEQELASLMKRHEIASQRYREFQETLERQSSHTRPNSTEMEDVERVRRDAFHIETRIEYLLSRLRVI
jgi:hypothetical protein